MSDPEFTSRILSQGRALVRAIEALGTIEPTAPFEHALTCFLMAAYKRRYKIKRSSALAETSHQYPFLPLQCLTRRGRNR
jgi:hypothetical protein